MQEYFPPKGLIIELISIKERDRLKEHLESVKDIADAIFLFSPYVGKGFSLSLEEKKDIVGACIEVLQERQPVFIFVTSFTEEDTIKNIREFEKMVGSYKRDIFWVDAPLYYHSNRGLPDMYERFSSMTDYPFILYNDPKIVDGIKGPFNRRNIRTSILKELSFLKNVKGLIFIGGIRRAINYQNAVRERPYFRIYDGDEELYLNFPNRNGIVSMSANIIPHIWKNILNEDEEKRRDLWIPLLELIEILKIGGYELISSLIFGKSVTCNNSLFEKAKEILRRLDT